MKPDNILDAWFSLPTLSLQLRWFLYRPHSATAKASVPYPFPAQRMSIRRAQLRRPGSQTSTAPPRRRLPSVDGEVHRRLPVFQIPFASEKPLLHPAAEARPHHHGPPAVPFSVQHQGVVGGDIRLCQGGEVSRSVFSSGMACIGSAAHSGDQTVLGRQPGQVRAELPEVLGPLSPRRHSV